MLFVGAIAAAVRLPGVYGRPFWEDEVASARIVIQPTFQAMLHQVGQTESTPPLWYAIVWLAHRVGMPLQSERLLSVAFGAMFAAAVVKLARCFVPLPLATAAGLMTALGAEFVVHGAELRAYELLALLSVTLGLSVLKVLEHPSRRWDVGLAATVAAGCLTHYFFAFSVGAVLTWLWLDPGARHVRRRSTVATLVGGAFAALSAPVLWTQYGHGRFRWIGAFQLRSVAAVPLRLFTYAYNDTPVGLALTVSALGALAIGGIHLARSSAGGRLVVSLASGPIAAAAAAWAAGVPIFDLRNLVGVGAYVAVLAVALLDTLSLHLKVVAAAAIVGSMALSSVTSTAERIPAYDAMARSLVRHGWNASRPILVYGDPYRYRLPFEWYLPRQPVLEMSRVLAGSCAEVFVVTPSGKVRREGLRAPLSSDRSLHHATLLVDPAHGPRCVSVHRSEPPLKSDAPT
jgi:hypothetical protein